jgi:hypothetical protein
MTSITSRKKGVVAMQATLKEQGVVYLLITVASKPPIKQGYWVPNQVRSENE